MINTDIKELELDLEVNVSGINGFVAELFWIEMEKMRTLQPSTTIEPAYVVCNGNSGRNSSKDVMKVRRMSHLVGHTYETLHTILLSRNGIYHSLPEALFHPLALGTVYSSVDDIVESIKKNQKDTIACKQFFSLFDHKFFEYKTSLLKRELKWPYNNESFTISLVKRLLGLYSSLTQKQAILLLSTIKFHQDIKASYELQASLLTLLIETKVTIKERKHQFKDLPYNYMGASTLGIDAGLSGPCNAEINDLEIDVWVPDPDEIDKNIMNRSKEEFVKEIMSLFNFSTRQLFIRYQIEKEDAVTYLGKKGFLGINTCIAES